MRDRARFSQRQLAERLQLLGLNVSRDQVMNWERSHSVPSFQEWIACMKVCRVSRMYVPADPRPIYDKRGYDRSLKESTTLVLRETDEEEIYGGQKPNIQRPVIEFLPSPEPGRGPESRAVSTTSRSADAQMKCPTPKGGGKSKNPSHRRQGGGGGEPR